MKGRITDNWGLKVISFVFAVVIWVIVININDPVISYKVYDVPVTIKNADLITKNGQIYEVLENSNIIEQVTVTAPRSIIDSLDASNIVAVADMNDLSNVDTIAIKLSTNKYNDKLESIKGSIDTVKLNIENKQIKSLPIRTSTTGEVKEGYIIGDVTTEQNLIRISGPESVISQISKAIAEIDISGFTNHIGTDTEIRFYNDDGQEIVSNNIEKSISRVRINVDILQTKTVPVQAKASGIPAEGYQFTGEIKTSRSNVLVAGRTKVVEDVQSIDIRAQDIDLTGATSDVVVRVNLSNYLPSGVIIAEKEFDGMINVTATVEEIKEADAVLPVTKINMINMPDDFEYEIIDSESEMTVTLCGLQQYLEGVEGSTISATIDIESWMADEEIEELSTGTYRIPVMLQLPNVNVMAKDEVEVRVRITKK